MLRYPVNCGGLFVSGGNMANFVCFLAARQAKADWDVRKHGMTGTRLRAYCSNETHTWIQKAADIAGLGTDAIRWIAVDAEARIDLAALREQISSDIAAGDKSIPGRRQCRHRQHRRHRPASRSSPRSAASSISGFMSTEPTAASPLFCLTPLPRSSD